MTHIQAKFQTTAAARGQHRVASPRPPKQPRPPRVPHVAKLMALAIRLDHLLATGQVKDQAEIARTAGITRARVTQIMNLNNLAPDIQADIIELTDSECGPDRITEREVGKIASAFDWKKQQKQWETKLRCRNRNQRQSVPELANAVVLALPR